MTIQNPEPNPPQGFWVHYADEEDVTSHLFCGEHHDASAVCPNCNKPLLLFLELDASDQRLGIPARSYVRVPLYYCWTCDLSQALFAYKLNPQGSIQILKFRSGSQQKDFPYPDYPHWFPGAQVCLIALSHEEQAAVGVLNSSACIEQILQIEEQTPELARPRHQVGGEPLLLQGWPDHICPSCGKQAPLLASIGNDCLDSRGLAGYDFVQVLFTFCRECDVVMASNACD